MTWVCLPDPHLSTRKYSTLEPGGKRGWQMVVSNAKEELKQFDMGEGAGLVMEMRLMPLFVLLLRRNVYKDVMREQQIMFRNVQEPVLIVFLRA